MSQSAKVVERIAVGHMPRGIALPPDGRQNLRHQCLVRQRLGDRCQHLQIVRTLPAGFEPSGVFFDPRGKTLYVANRLSNDVSVIDSHSGKETKRLLAGRGASYLAISPDGK